ncbi:aspartate/glutamate racemase family protein [Nocardioides euryhalodurans]|uniref:Amino acid racemase n=1 Tax=Nocardioides euryhalodurans TaxID=2518370 RepID=A0A4V1BE09_9ACTN|nr:amino acid racemase [Nocardioides euryhalodurans]QBR92982.1 amino acid racemase [Nocardioides euryhalodurans]
MKTIGLIGGMSWHSTASYYRIINETVAQRLGGHSSAQIALQSLDFAAVRQCQVEDDWAGAGDLLSRAAAGCVAGGADVVAICTNLMHKVAPAVEASVDVPLLHIADAVAGVAAAHGWDRLGILGARWVMEEPFYAERLARHGITAMVPEADDRTLVDRVVFDELTRGVVAAESRAAYVGVIDRLAQRGAQAVVLACTEIGLLVGPDDSPLPVVDSAEAHARALAELALTERVPA